MSWPQPQASLPEALLRAGGQLALLAAAQWLLNRVTARARPAPAAADADRPSPDPLPPGRLAALWLLAYPRFSVWLWVCSLYWTVDWHLGPWLGLAGSGPGLPPWRQHFVLLVSGLCALSFLGRATALTNRRLRVRVAADASHWGQLLAVVGVDGLQLALPLAAVYFVLPGLGLSAGAQADVRQVFSMVFIGAVGYLLIRLVNLAADKVRAGHETLGAGTSVRRRTIYTQVALLRRMALVVVGFVTLGSMLMVFASVRHLGASLLASAGVVGIVVGVAAQRSLANLVAGFQIAVTQPILLGDAVTVEGEYGQIEEITLTYVVVRLGDLRRLVLPIAYFLEKPFRNWTRGSPEVLGTVTLWVDHLAPVDALEAGFARVLATPAVAALWNGQSHSFTVSEMSERGVQLSLTLSASDPDRLSDLRAAVRRAMVDLLRREHPEALPRQRASIDRDDEERAAAPFPAASGSGAHPHPDSRDGQEQKCGVSSRS